MQPWAVSAAIAAVFIATHYLFLRAASGRIGDALGALVLEGTAALGIAGYYIVRGRLDGVTTTRGGVVYAGASGLAIAVASILIFQSLRRGGPVASTGTLVLGGGVALSALIAPFLFAEALTPRRFVGVALGVVGMAILATER
ncbi:hypothetical protein BH09MYX1_BH09MYX1_59230 [soil metagenome]